MLYGNLPADLGFIDAPCEEMLFWMYCPIFVPGATTLVIPPNLYQFRPIVDAAIRDLEDREVYYFDDDLHIYLTAKTLYVQGSYIGNRPGWHSDGFGTDDVNYIWSDRAPTQFLHLDPPVELSTCCTESMQQMERLAHKEESLGAIDFAHTTFPDKHLLRLDQSVIHRSPIDFEPGMRTFVKVSVSKDRYDLKGNAINHGLVRSRWPLVDRKVERNHPQSVR